MVHAVAEVGSGSRGSDWSSASAANGLAEWSGRWGGLRWAVGGCLLTAEGGLRGCSTSIRLLSAIVCPAPVVPGLSAASCHLPPPPPSARSIQLMFCRLGRIRIEFEAEFEAEPGVGPGLVPEVGAMGAVCFVSVR